MLIYKQANMRITMQNARNLLQWANEYGINGSRIDSPHIGRSGVFSQYEHLHINGMHIKIFP